ncbi:3-hydroxyacyl-ACP dehydratase FabZ [Inquilinus limosus]|uniref:3-hydroxyacyl-[acyl-carrier-protein] dehydratase FabZ n=1 Tax=Inquilinus limosus MP06 TaxID=1398085 RepID=A0A0A0D402_9PROT|nr:3-hydroxyacyl-ACP dehydratase FabZ [Inquilinus limosus]KGM32829.1 3-hydroxyacyl-ACP dehydratase [Inquilinus limosus MP06]
MDGAASDKKNMSQLDILKIMEMIPHRYPMILVDRVIDVVPDVSCTGIKNVTINEGFFQGHFPRYPVMPGVMIVESMAQTAAVLVVATLGEEANGKLVYFMTVDNARFRRPVTPGDSLRVHVKKLQQRRNVWKFTGEVKVDDVLVAQAEFAAMIMDDL